VPGLDLTAEGELRSWFETEIGVRLPSCRILYWT